MNISKYFQHRFTLSEDGAKTFIKGVIASLFLNLALMLPVIFIFLFITDYLHPVIQAGNSTTHGLWYYVLTALCFLCDCDDTVQEHLHENLYRECQPSYWHCREAA